MRARGRHRMFETRAGSRRTRLHGRDDPVWQILFPAGTYDSIPSSSIAADASTVALFSDSIDEADGRLTPSVEGVENSVLCMKWAIFSGFELGYESVDHEDRTTPVTQATTTP